MSRFIFINAAQSCSDSPANVLDIVAVVSSLHFLKDSMAFREFVQFLGCNGIC